MTRLYKGCCIPIGSSIALCHPYRMKGRNSDYTIGLEVAYLASIPQAFLSLMKMDKHADIHRHS